MKIKTWFLILFCWVLSAGQTFSYQPTGEEQQELTALKSQLREAISWDNIALWNLYTQARDLETWIQAPEKLNYKLQHLRDYLLTILDDKKELLKRDAKDKKSEFLALYQWSGVASAEPLSENCIGRYPTLDAMSFAYDFPTSLSIAIWYRETSCGFYLPKNGNWPFQIITKQYGNWSLDRALFEQTIKDFLEFSKKKIERYNSKNPETPIRLWYDSINYKDLYKFAGLYNGLSGGTVYWEIWPANPKYFLEKVPWERENGKRNGLFLQVLKVLEWEVK